MTFDEILQSQGLSAEQVEAIKGEMKQNKVFTAGEENLDVRYGKLKGDYDGVNSQLTEAQKLIEEMKKSEGANEQLQGKISEYEQRIQQLEAEKQQLAVESALQVALLEANADDVDYLTFKIKEQGDLALDDNGKIKGIDETIENLKTQFPNQFKSEANRKIDENKLHQGDGGNAITTDQFKKMGYQQRVDLFNKDPELYETLSKGE